MRGQLLILIIGGILMLNLVSASYGIGGSNSYGIGSTATNNDIISAINYSTVSVNDSQFLRGYTWETNPYFGSSFNSSYVPYTGATSDVDLGNNNLTNEGYINTSKLYVTSIGGALAKFTTSSTSLLVDFDNTNTGTTSFRFLDGGSARWMIGSDGADSDKFKISGSSTFGSNFVMSFTRSASPSIFINGSTLINHNLNVSGNFTGNQFYGGMYYHNHTGTTLPFSVDGRYYSLFMTNATYLNGFTAGNITFGLNSSLTTKVAGLYAVNYMASGEGVNNHDYFTSIFVNEMNQDACEHHHKMIATGDIITQSGNCFIRLKVNDIVSVRTADIGGTGNGVYYSSNLDLVRIGT